MDRRGKFKTTWEYAVACALISGLGALPRHSALRTVLAIGHTGYSFDGRLRRTRPQASRIFISSLSLVKDRM